jgi:hypothetical protein
MRLNPAEACGLQILATEEIDVVCTQVVHRPKLRHVILMSM